MSVGANELDTFHSSVGVAALRCGVRDCCRNGMVHGKDALESRGISVWFDEIQIKVRKGIGQEIKKGITNCRFGIVVISPAFFAKQCTQAELDALFSNKMDSGENLILPVWHKVTKDEVQTESPLLAGIHARNSPVQTRDEIAIAFAAVVRAETND